MKGTNNTGINTYELTRRILKNSADKLYDYFPCLDKDVDSHKLRLSCGVILSSFYGNYPIDWENQIGFIHALPKSVKTKHKGFLKELAEFTGNYLLTYTFLQRINNLRPDKRIWAYLFPDFFAESALKDYKPEPKIAEFLEKNKDTLDKINAIRFINEFCS